jgi:hypothetical protein
MANRLIRLPTKITDAKNENNRLAAGAEDRVLQRAPSRLPANVRFPPGTFLSGRLLVSKNALGNAHLLAASCRCGAGSGSDSVSRRIAPHLQVGTQLDQDFEAGY